MSILCSLFLVASYAVSAYSQKDVRLPPSIKTGPKPKEAFRETQEITLSCKAEGTKPLTYEWRLNGVVLHVNLPKFRFHGVSEGDLTILSATREDDGYYQCFVTNQYGTALSTVAPIQHAFLQETTQSYSNVAAQDGLPFVIEAARRKSYPTPNYNWETATGIIDQNPRPFQSSPRVRTACNGDLHFAYAEKADELSGNIYKSIVYNAVTDQRLGGSYTRVMVTTGSGTPPDFPPNITYFKSQEVALIGRDIELKCFFSGKPLPDITWSGPKNNLPSGRFNTPSDHFKTILNISNIMESDAGDYVCTARNTEGTASHTLNVRVEAVPVFSHESDGPYNVNVTEGDSVTFNCSASAKPEATVVWFLNGKSIDVKTAPKRFAFSNDAKSLTIRDVCRDCVDRESKTDLMVIQCNASNAHGYAFAQGYLNVLKKYCEKEEHPIAWNRKSAGEEVTQPCPGDTTGLCSRKCLPNSTWSQPNCNGCNDKEFNDLLKKANGEALNQTRVVEIAKQLQVLTSKSEVLSPRNLNASVMVMKQLAVLLRNKNISLNKNQIESLVQVISNVLQPNNAASWKELENVNRNEQRYSANMVDTTFAANILSICDDFGLVSANLSTPGHVTVSTDNLVLEAWSFKKSKLPLQIEFPNGSEWGENRGDGVSISLETLKDISSKNQSTLNMWGVYYRTMDKILPGKKEGDDVINSKILSFSIGGLKTNQTLKPPVIITLRHNQDKRRSYPRTCAFWNFKRNDWDSFGCSVASTNKTHTICSCDHLTNFAILMSKNPVKDDLLSLISIIGCSISVAALVLTVIVYAATWKHAKSSQAALLLNLCIALIIAYIIFMAGADKTESSGFTKVGCKVVAGLLHYFFLVAFFIMFAEGIDMVLYIFFVFHVRRTRETVMLVASAWVLPLIIVGVSLGVSKVEGYGHKEACWLSIDDGLIWAFIGPVMCIIAINLVILIIILRLISQKKALLAGNGKKRDEIRATIWNLSVMCPVLGLGWLFGVFSVSFDHVAFQYVFVIANSLHGLLIFIIYALFHNKKMNEKISSVYSNCIGRCGKTGLSVFTKLSSSQDHSTSSTSNTQLTSDRKKSTSEAAPAYGVIADMTSAQKT